MEDKINIATIAKMAGVASSTVSHLINCTEHIPISAEKRKRIMDAMRAANYRPSAASSSLRRNCSLPRKAVFIHGGFPENSAFDTCKDPMLGELISALSRELDKTLGLDLEVRAVKDEGCMATWNETIADAEALVCYGRLSAPLFELSTRRNIPLVVISDSKRLRAWSLDGEEPLVDYVFWDSASHLARLLEHVVAKGARRLAFVSSWNIKANRPDSTDGEAQDKIEEFKTFVASVPGVGGSVLCPPMPPDTSPFYEGRNAFEFLRGQDLKGFDAIIGHNDYVAQGVISALREQGIAPGRDVLVCGEGDYLECRHSFPGITTISYDKASLAESVCATLGRRLKENRPLGEATPILSHLIERETTRRI